DGFREIDFFQVLLDSGTVDGLSAHAAGLAHACCRWRGVRHWQRFVREPGIRDEPYSAARTHDVATPQNVDAENRITYIPSNLVHLCLPGVAQRPEPNITAQRHEQRC